MKCNLNLLEQNTIPYSWNTLFVGVNLNILSDTQINNYAIQYLTNHPQETNHFIVELTFSSNTTSVTNKLLEALTTNLKPETKEWQIEERKLRFCLLTDLKTNIVDTELLLEKIAEVYAHFNYPPDMNEFIYYMPAKNYDPSQYSIIENRQRLLKIFSDFLNKEKKTLQ